MSPLNSHGECLFCKKEFSKTSIIRHLQKHLTDKTKDGSPGKSFLLKVEVNPKWGKWPHFLSLWVDGEAELIDLDEFLRQIWLECCHHLSSFIDPARKKNPWKDGFSIIEEGKRPSKARIEKFMDMMDEASGEIPKDQELKQVLTAESKLIYEYDFGSTTSLVISVAGVYPAKADDDIVLLSRNEPLEILCDTCGKEPASTICSTCVRDGESAFCKKCAKLHRKNCDDYEYSSLPVVNSPRMGVCGYEGGRIDKKRDGVFKKKV